MGRSEDVMPFRAGEWVQVKEWAEIVQTLDADGTLDGLPFMPEMVECCGHQYQVLRYAGKICVEASGGIFTGRVVAKPDVVLLADVRCSGLSHDGCQRSCMIFWKTGWLRKSTRELPVGLVTPTQQALATERLKVKESPTKYFCQATQLMKISRDQSSIGDTLSQVCRDLRTGAVGIFQMIFLVFVPCFNKLRRKLWGWPHMGGTLARTPVERLGLKAGDLVEVKSLKEMQATLNSAGRNRGLQCDKGFAHFCTKQFTVRGRLDRIISETTGQMHAMDSTVTLEGAPCPCALTAGGCTRYDFAYFREIWLRKIPSKDEARENVDNSLS